MHIRHRHVRLTSIGTTIIRTKQKLNKLNENTRHQTTTPQNQTKTALGQTKLANSKSEVRRMIKNNGLKINNEIIKD